MPLNYFILIVLVLFCCLIDKIFQSDIIVSTSPNDINYAIDWIELINTDWMYIMKGSYYASRSMVYDNFQVLIDSIHMPKPIKFRIYIPFIYCYKDDLYLSDNSDEPFNHELLVNSRNTSLFPLNQYLSILRTNNIDTFQEKNLLWSTDKYDNISIKTTIFSLKNEISSWDFVIKRFIELMENISGFLNDDSSFYKERIEYLYLLLILSNLIKDVLMDFESKLRAENSANIIIPLESFQLFINDYKDLITTTIDVTKALHNIKQSISSKVIIKLFSIYYQESLLPFLKVLLKEQELYSSLLIKKTTNYDKEQDDDSLLVIIEWKKNQTTNSKMTELQRIYFW